MIGRYWTTDTDTVLLPRPIYTQLVVFAGPGCGCQKTPADSSSSVPRPRRPYLQHCISIGLWSGCFTIPADISVLRLRQIHTSLGANGSLPQRAHTLQSLFMESLRRRPGGNVPQKPQRRLHHGQESEERLSPTAELMQRREPPPIWMVDTEATGRGITLQLTQLEEIDCGMLQHVSNVLRSKGYQIFHNCSLQT